MEVRFSEKYLEVLFVEGKDDKKHRFQPDIIKRYIRCIKYLQWAENIEKLYEIHSLNYKVLTGDKAGISAIRVNEQYRIEFLVQEDVVTICNILTLSNHYK